MASSSGSAGDPSWPLTKSFLSPIYEKMRTTQDSWINTFSDLFNIIVASDSQISSNDYSVYHLLHQEFTLQARSDRLKFENDYGLPAGSTIPTIYQKTHQEIEETSRQCRANAPRFAEALKQLAIKTQADIMGATTQGDSLEEDEIESREIQLLQFVEKRFPTGSSEPSIHYRLLSETIKHHRVLRGFKGSNVDFSSIDNTSFSVLVKHFGLRHQLNGVISQAA